MPVLPTLAVRLGAEWVAQAAVAVAVFGMGLAGLFTAWLITRLGFGRTMLVSWILFGVFGSVGLLSVDTPVLLASRLALGLTAGALMTTAGIAIATLHRDDESAQSRMMGISLAVSPFAAVAFLFVAAVVARFSWRAPFALHGVLALLAVALVLCARLPSAPTRAAATPRYRWRQLRPALPAFALLALAVGVGNLFSVQIAFLLASRGLGDPSTVATVTSTLLIGLGVTYIGFGWLEQRIELRGTTASGLMGFAFGALLCGGITMLATTIVGMILGGIAQGLLVTTAMMMIMRRSDPDTVPFGLGGVDKF